MSARLRDLRDFGLGLMAHGLFGVAALLPYRARVRGLGWFVARVIAPMAGFTRIIRDNLAMTCPDLPEAERRRLTRSVPDNAGRTLVEILFRRDLKRYARAAPVSGDEGLAALEQARAEGRGALLMTAHLGNFMVSGFALRARGFKIGAIYRPLNNRWLNARWVSALQLPLDDIFARERRDMARMIRFLRDGGMVFILNDQHSMTGAPLTFFDRTAYTALSAAEMALKYDALMVPIYSLRQPDGLNFEVIVEPPIPHSTPERMIQQYNDSLERLVRDNMDQWLWLHRRWKPRSKRQKPAGTPPSTQTPSARETPAPRSSAAGWSEPS